MEETVNKCYLEIPGYQHHSDPTGWNLAVWDGWRGLTKVILLQDPKCLGLAMPLDMFFIHLLKRTWAHGPASLLGLGDIPLQSRLSGISRALAPPKERPCRFD